MWVDPRSGDSLQLASDRVFEKVAARASDRVVAARAECSLWVDSGRPYSLGVDSGNPYSLGIDSSSRDALGAHPRSPLGADPGSLGSLAADSGSHTPAADSDHKATSWLKGSMLKFKLTES